MDKEQRREPRLIGPQDVTPYVMLVTKKGMVHGFVRDIAPGGTGITSCLRAELELGDWCDVLIPRNGGPPIVARALVRHSDGYRHGIEHFDDQELDPSKWQIEPLNSDFRKKNKLS